MNGEQNATSSNNGTIDSIGITKQFQDEREGSAPKWSEEVVRSILYNPDWLGSDGLEINQTYKRLESIGQKIAELYGKNGLKNIETYFEGTISDFEQRTGASLSLTEIGSIDVWGNEFTIINYPNEAKSSNVFSSDCYLKFAMFSAGNLTDIIRDVNSGSRESSEIYKLFLKRRFHLSGYLCHDSNKIVWCIAPEEPYCEYSVPVLSSKDFASIHDDEAKTNQYAKKRKNALKRSNKEDVKWYTIGAEEGYARSQFQLGVMYMNGHGLPQDYIQAHMWLNLASANGNKSARDLLLRLSKDMTPESVIEAQEMTREWIKTHSEK